MFKLTLFCLLAATSIAQELYNEDELLLSDVYDGELNHQGADEELVRVRRGFSGGMFGLPGGGSTQQIGYTGSVYSTPMFRSFNDPTPPRHQVSAWGQLSQSSNRLGMTGPISYSAGADWVNNGARGLSGSITHVPKVGSQATLGGHTTLFSNENHQLTGSLQHTRNFDKNFRQVGPASNTGSLTYQHASGTSVGVSGTRTPGMPNSGSVSAQVPVASFAGGKGQVSVGATSTFAEGHRPNHEAGIQVKITP